MSASFQLSLQLGIFRNRGRSERSREPKSNSTGKLCLSRSNLPATSREHYSWSSIFSKRLCLRTATSSCTNHRLRCCCLLNPGPFSDPKFVKNATFSLARSFNAMQQSPLVIKLASAVGLVVFTIWGLGPLVQLSRNNFFQKKDGNWKKSSTYLVITSYIQPFLLWMGAIFICRTLDPMPLPTEAGHIVKQRLLAFVRSLSTVLAFGYCFSSVIQQLQKYLMETRDPSDARNMGFQFASKAVYTAVWVAAVSLFMELLGFSAQRWLTAGGLGTVLLTLAGREIFTNFLSSAMIHATRPFVPNEWIQTKIDGYEVSGTVERIGWWSPTIIRGEDREAVHIPNYKFTMNVVRNLTQKTHWRIKTHLSISHLDVRKINNIVADMRKVLSKHPQVEHKKLHRRVFLENIEPENQALKILVSCFVKTPHIEEYLRVKEIILLDLLRVVRHHRARLATPIRTVQKIYTDADLDNVPFSDSMYDEGKVSNRPLLLIEPSYKISGEDKSKSQTRAPRATGDDDKALAKAAPDSKIDSKPKATSPEPTTKEVQMHETKSEAPQISNVETKDDPVVTRKASPTHESGGRRQSKASLEENIVLGVALEGSKRTLPIEEEVEPSEDRKELASLRSGPGPMLDEKEKGDVKNLNNPGSPGNDE